jgi:hypothetical protein
MLHISVEMAPPTTDPARTTTSPLVTGVAFREGLTTTMSTAIPPMKRRNTKGSAVTTEGNGDLKESVMIGAENSPALQGPHNEFVEKSYQK